MTLKLGWFSTGRDEAARNLLQVVWDDIRIRGYDAEIEWIFCHRTPGDGPENSESLERAKFFELADSMGIPVNAISHLKFMPELRQKGLMESRSAAEASADLKRWRDLFGMEVVETLKDRPVDLVVMAGYMLIIGKPELNALNLVNIHPALPWGPRGTWQECIHEIIDTRSHEHGIMTHIVTETLDRGPVISFCRFPVQGEQWDELWRSWEGEIGLKASKEERENHPLFKKIRETGEIRELPLLKEAIYEIARGAIEIREGRVWSVSRTPSPGKDLTDQIEEAVDGIEP
jgi:folate-dependent phosphoribosylglycinamide formyltransferase PurN